MINQQLDIFENFECICTSDEHRLSFRLQNFNAGNDDDCPDQVELYISIFLNNYQSFWKRIWIAMKYIFGYKCQYGHWDQWSLRHEDADKLINLIKNFKELRGYYTRDSKHE